MSHGAVNVSTCRSTSEIDIPQTDASVCSAILEAELDALTPQNCARYRITLGETQAWIERGRPR
jgi:hypothetical protein